MGSEMQPEVMRTQKREIQISRVNKILLVVFIWNLQLFSKLILKLVTNYSKKPTKNPPKIFIKPAKNP
jgi:cell division protein FtsL